MMNTMTDDKLLTLYEVAERLRLNPETVRRWLNTGKLRGRKLGSTRAGWRIKESDLAAFIDAGEPSEREA